MDAHSKTLSAMYHIRRQGPVRRKHAVNTRLSPEARNTITIENDENKWGLDASLELVCKHPCPT